MSSRKESFIKQASPEVFRVSPRKGHLNASFATSTQIGGDLLPPFLDESISKEFRVQTALDDTQSVDSEDQTSPNVAKDAMYMVSIAISSLMMLSTGKSDFPPEYLQWTKHCLECVKDDFGNHPPNVQGLINYLKSLTKGDESSKASPETGTEDETGAQTVKTTTRVKMGE